MSLRVALVLGLAAAIGVATALLALVLLGDSSSAREQGQTPALSGEYRGSKPPEGIALSDFSLRNYNGQRIRSSDLRGRVILVTFLDSQCTDSCPVIAWIVARTVDALSPAERREVEVVAISTDPAEDTPRSVRRFLARNRAVGRLQYLGGGQPASELRRVWNEFEILSSLESGDDTLHSAPVRVYDRRSVWVATLHAGADLTEANLAHDLRVALGE